MKEFATRHAVLNTERTQWKQVLFKGAHTDDEVMFRLTNLLAKHKIGVTIATGTDSGGRDLPLYTREEQPEVRWEEALRSGAVSGVAQVRRKEAPDGRYREFKQEGMTFLRDTVDEIKPLAIVSMHSGDEHPDHRAAYDISRTVAENKIPFYSTDTITGFDRFGRPLQPSLYIPLTEEIEEIERQAFRENSSQFYGIPEEDIPDRDNVISMTERRAKDLNQEGIDYAAVLFEANNTKTSPLREILVYANAA